MPRLIDPSARLPSATQAAAHEQQPVGVLVDLGHHTTRMLELAIHIGARISSLAAANEVLVTSTVRDLSVGSGQTLTDRGEHDLKGVPGPWRIFAVET